MGCELIWGQLYDAYKRIHERAKAICTDYK